MGYKYDPVRGTVISSETPYSFEERPDYDELHHQANLLKINQYWVTLQMMRMLPR